jgi:site-specific DNA-adenine methylase
MKIIFPYPGGKAKILDWLLPQFPQTGRRYVEPFAGRGNVFFEFFQRALFESYHLNDLNTGNFFQALARCPIDDLPRSQEDVDLSFEMWQTRATLLDPVALSIEPFATFRGKGYSSGRHDRYTYKKASNRILAAQNILQQSNVTWSKQDWVWLPWDEYNEYDFLYVDPPYIREDSTGYGDINHSELCKRLLASSAGWVLSGYDNEVYRQYLGKPEATLDRQIEMTNQINATATECVWSNL